MRVPLQQLKRWGWALAWFAVSVAPVQAQELVSARMAGVDVRKAPEADADVQWQLAKGYPLLVLQHQGAWVKVQDFEGDQGWVAANATDATPHHVVRVTAANLRAGPGTQYPVVGTAHYGQVLVTSLRQDEWVRIQRGKGKTAWVARELLWGW